MYMYMYCVHVEVCKGGAGGREGGKEGVLLSGRKWIEKGIGGREGERAEGREGVSE